jgi:hypothetical protein
MLALTTGLLFFISPNFSVFASTSAVFASTAAVFTSFWPVRIQEELVFHEFIILKRVGSSTLHLLPLVEQTGRDKQSGEKVKKQVSHRGIFYLFKNKN